MARCISVVIPFTRSCRAGTTRIRPAASQATMSGPVVQTSSRLDCSQRQAFTVASQDGTVRWRVLLETLPLTNGSTGTMVVGHRCDQRLQHDRRAATIDLLVSLVIIALPRASRSRGSAAQPAATE